MKLRAKWGALAASVLLAATLTPVAAFAKTSDRDVADTSVNITGLTSGDTVTAYQVFDADIDASNQVVYTAATGLPGKYDTVDELSALDASGAKAAAQAYAVAFSAGTAKSVKKAVTGTADTDGKAALPLDSGYWVVVVTTTSGKTKVYQPTTIDASPVGSNGSYSAATPSDTALKSQPVNITKTVQDKATQNYVDSTDTWTVGDLVPFKVTTAVPSYPSTSKNATFEIGDTPAAGLDVQTASIKVTVGDTTVFEEGSATTVDVFEAQGITLSSGGYTFKFTKDFILAHPGQAVEVTYQAKLTSAVKAEDGTTSNTATITFNPNPYSASTVTPDDTTNERTYGIFFKKVDSKGDALQGAEFTIYDSSNQVVMNVGNKGVVASDANGYVVFTGLGAGSYTLKETKVPAGKQAVNDFTVTITGNNAKADNPVTTNVSETNFLQVDGDSTVDGIQDVTDPDRGILPTTGEAGTMALTIGGAGLLVVGVAVLVRNRKQGDEA